MLAVLTMWPSPCAASDREGTRARRGSRPRGSRPNTHVHADSGPNHASACETTPALLHTTCTVPKRSIAAAASACTDASSLTSVRTVSVSTPCAPIRSRRGREARLVDVGEHHVHARRREPLRQREPDPARRAGDHRDLACLESHLALLRQSVSGGHAQACSGSQVRRLGGRLEPLERLLHSQPVVRGAVVDAAHRLAEELRDATPLVDPRLGDAAPGPRSARARSATRRL